ncbi:MAG: hypothetical protein EKK32_29300 [Bradyrhizobiaceae bacterium]|nr:MAG: hypothetical protein EKK32_29300 [Bradyrhizobiaceae bacterium]
MPGLVPGIHVVPRVLADVDGRDRPGHNDVETDGRYTRSTLCDRPAPAWRRRHRACRTAADSLTRIAIVIRSHR